MFEIFIIFILAILTKKVAQKIKYYWKTTKKKREIANIFWNDFQSPTLKVKRGLKKSFRKNKVKLKKDALEALDMEKYPQIKTSTKAVQANFILLPIILCWDWGLLLIPIISVAVEMFDWSSPILKMPPCCRPLARDSNGYWFCVVINETSGRPYITESRDDGADWGSNHATYDNNGTILLAPSGDAEYGYNLDYDTISLTITDDDKLHTMAITPDYRGTNHLFTYGCSSSGDISNMTNWRGYNSNSPPNADWVCVVGDAVDIPHSASMTHIGNLVLCVWSQKIIAGETGEYEIKYRKRLSTLLNVGGGTWGSIRNITASSSQDNYAPAIAIDGNDHVHVVWYNTDGDDKIKYAHAHGTNDATWYQSDDVSAVTTGESGETIMTNGGDDFQLPSIAVNFYPDYLNDLWVSGVDDSNTDLYTTQYDKSATAWQAKAKISDTDLVDDNGQLGVDADGNVHAMWSLVTTGSIRGSEYDGASWGAVETLQT